MDERLTDEQLQAIRERQEAVKATALKEHEARQALEQDSSAAEKHYALINAEFEWEDARRHAEAFADEDIEALLAHIDALEAEIGALREAILNLGGDPDQAWFWTDRWQQLEREAQEDIDAGRVEDASDFLAE